jgi:hypothetical protein
MTCATTLCSACCATHPNGHIVEPPDRELLRSDINCWDETLQKTGLVNGQGEKGYAVRPTESNWSTGAVVQTVEEEFC